MLTNSEYSDADDNSEKTSFPNETEHSCLPRGNGNVTFFEDRASQQSTPPAEEVVLTFDDEDGNCAEIETKSDRVTPPAPGEAAQSEGCGDTDLPSVPIEQYHPGVNHLMSGGVSLLDEINTDLAPDDDIICVHGLVRQRMPYKVLRRGELFDLGLPFQDASWLEDLPRGFLTTFRGLDRAVEEFWASDPGDFANEMEVDLALLSMIVKRGGRARTKFQQVVYPEEIVPLDDLDCSAEGISAWNGEQEARDEEYWEELREQGRIWDELYIP
ncbi:hypothetical protein CLAIMM_04548 [Cladophialophora immunda]|nr:hypothetical protein CLAIMM_04548 [Cladophialophora immunda]